MTERFRDGSAFEEKASYSRAVRAGRLVLVSGTAAVDAEGAALYTGDSYLQTQEAIRRAVAAVEALGGTRDDVVRTRLYLVPDAHWPEAVRAHAEAFAGVDPANTTLYVAGFIPRGVLVEVELDAVLPNADGGS